MQGIIDKLNNNEILTKYEKEIIYLLFIKIANEERYEDRDNGKKLS